MPERFTAAPHGAVPVHLAVGVEPFERIIARYDGARFLFQEVDRRRSPAIAAYLDLTASGAETIAHVLPRPERDSALGLAAWMDQRLLPLRGQEPQVQAAALAHWWRELDAPGRFLLTGSADVLALPRVSESLAGRMEVLTLWPLSQGELAGVREGFIDALFAAAKPGLGMTGTTRADLVERALRGGFPEAVARGATSGKPEN